MKINTSRTGLVPVLGNKIRETSTQLYPICKAPVHCNPCHFSFNKFDRMMCRGRVTNNTICSIIWVISSFFSARKNTSSHVIIQSALKFAVKKRRYLNIKVASPFRCSKWPPSQISLTRMMYAFLIAPLPSTHLTPPHRTPPPPTHNYNYVFKPWFCYCNNWQSFPK